MGTPGGKTRSRPPVGSSIGPKEGARRSTEHAGPGRGDGQAVLGVCPSNSIGRAHGACESQARREEETMLVASLTTSNEAWGRNPHVPKGFVAAPGRPRRFPSPPLTHIAGLAAPPRPHPGAPGAAPVLL